MGSAANCSLEGAGGASFLPVRAPAVALEVWPHLGLRRLVRACPGHTCCSGRPQRLPIVDSVVGWAELSEAQRFPLAGMYEFERATQWGAVGPCRPLSAMAICQPAAWRRRAKGEKASPLAIPGLGVC